MVKSNTHRYHRVIISGFGYYRVVQFPKNSGSGIKFFALLGSGFRVLITRPASSNNNGRTRHLAFVTPSRRASKAIASKAVWGRKRRNVFSLLLQLNHVRFIERVTMWHSFQWDTSREYTWILPPCPLSCAAASFLSKEMGTVVTLLNGCKNSSTFSGHWNDCIPKNLAWCTF